MGKQISVGLNSQKDTEDHEASRGSSRTWLRVAYRSWLKLGEMLGHVNSRIVLGILFLFVFVPIGITMRIFNKQFLSLGFDSEVDSYKIIVSRNDLVQRMEGPY